MKFCPEKKTTAKKSDRNRKKAMIDHLPYVLGAYRLESVLREKEDTIVYAAVQTVVERAVEVTVLKDSAANSEKAFQFVADARVKASVHFDKINEVIDAGEVDGMRYVATERIEGESLLELIERGDRLTMRQTISLLIVLADVAAYLAGKGISAALLTADMIYKTADDDFVLSNPARDGEVKEELKEWMENAGKIIETVRPLDQQGAGRVETLCEWMREGDEGARLTWQELRQIVKQIEEQLGLTKTTKSLTAALPSIGLSHAVTEQLRKTLVKPAKKIGRVVACISVLVFSALGLVLLLSPKNGDVAPKKPQPVHYVPFKMAGKSSMWIDVSPVTIQEYASFLRAFSKMSKAQKQNIIGENGDEKMLVPDEWNGMYKAAVRKTKWQGREVLLKDPVVFVNYYMAAAYAQYKGGRIPSKEEMIEATTSKVASRLHFVKGLSEWTSSRDRRGAMYEPGYAVCNAQGRMSVVNETRRAVDMGFRVIYDNKPLR